MFVVVILEDKIKIAPEFFDQDNTDMILAEIDQKFINKVSLRPCILLLFWGIISALTLILFLFFCCEGID